MYLCVFQIIGKLSFAKKKAQSSSFFFYASLKTNIHRLSLRNDCKENMIIENHGLHITYKTYMYLACTREYNRKSWLKWDLLSVTTLWQMQRSLCVWMCIRSLLFFWKNKYGPVQKDFLIEKLSFFFFPRIILNSIF